MPTRSRLRGFVLLAAAAFLIGGVAAVLLDSGLRNRLAGGAAITTTGTALVGGPFTLVDQTGRTVTDQDYRGRYLLVFFGFTNCPDVCPTGLQTISAALDQIGSKAERMTPILITIDPERDRPEVLADYVKAFHPRMIGLTGTAEQIQSAAKAYRVYYKKVPTGTAGDYTMDHTSIIYLMGPDGAFITHFTAGTPSDALAARLAKLN